MSVIKQALSIYTQIAKAQESGNQAYIDSLQAYFTNWDKEENNRFFGHHAPIMGFIPTNYPALNHIVSRFKPNIGYEIVDDPATIVNFDEPEKTRIRMPHPSAFKTPTLYAATLTHELAHATQPPLHRMLIEPDSEELLKQGRDNPRRTEELVAQMTSNKLMAMVGEDIERWSAIYLASVLTTLPPFIHSLLLEQAEHYSNVAFKYLTTL